MSNDTIAFKSALELMVLMESGKISSVELTQHFLERIKAHNSDLNAIAAHDTDAAIEDAKAADAARSSGEAGFLCGLPVTIKDALETEGLVTTSGAPEYKDHVPSRDADAVARLRAAGAVILGKSNTPYMSGDWQSFNAIYGCTNNPWDLTKTPGGSSGGAAAALAAGLSAADIGSDVGGSIRIPAHFCGIFGHKPSYGLVPKRGHIPGPPGSLHESDLSVLGPLARSAADLEIMLNVLAGPREGEIAWQLALPEARATKAEDLRVAVWADDPFSPVEGEVVSAVHTAAEALAGIGASVDYQARPDISFPDAHENYAILMHALMTSTFPAKVRNALASRAAGLGENDKSHPALQYRGAALSYAGSLELLEKQARMNAAWAMFFTEFDVLLCPPTNVPAFPHDHNPNFWKRQIDINGEARSYGDLMHWAGLATGAHLPATAAPVGRTLSGLPLGVQIIGPYQEDLTPIEVAKMLESEGFGFSPPPDYA